MVECITKRKTINAKRKELLEYIKKNPNKLIHMDKSDLEELLFETNYALGFDSNSWGYEWFNLKGFKSAEELTSTYKSMNDVKKYGILAKFPVWTGDFLKHIDLSEVDWSNVVWDPEVISEFDIQWLYDMEEFEYITKPQAIPSCIDTECDFCVNLSGTNAIIDFNESFSAKLFKNGINNLLNINFNGVNLSKSNTKSITSIGNCDLRYTGFVVNRDDFVANSSDLRTLNLAGIKSLFMAGFSDNDNCTCYFENCNVADTGLYIYSHMLEQGKNFYTSKFAEDIEKGFYDNCTINLGIIDLNDDLDDYDDYDDDNDFDDDDLNDGFGFGF